MEENKDSRENEIAALREKLVAVNEKEADLEQALLDNEKEWRRLTLQIWKKMNGKDVGDEIQYYDRGKWLTGKIKDFEFSYSSLHVIVNVKNSKGEYGLRKKSIREYDLKEPFRI